MTQTLNEFNAGDGIKSSTAEWKFSTEVAKNFNNHVIKSVPYYQETHQLAVEISDWFVHENCKVYDIGCATGTLIADLMRRHVRKCIHFTGIDTSAAMLEESRKILNGFHRICLHQENALSFPFESDLSMIYSLYTLQFIDPQHRLELCQKIHDSLSRRGAFVLVEKVLDHDPVMTDIYTHLHWSKKEEMGFDVTEIYAKAQSLRGVLVPFTAEENIQLLQQAGFSRISYFFKWCNFLGLVAVK
jgi:tRNA (cmo5U34)-methyltransferase